MDQTTARARPATTLRFQDGLGKRLLVTGITPEPLGVLVLKEEFAQARGFQEALRTQVARLVSFRHPSFLQVKGVGRPPNQEAGVAVISESIDGDRLSDLLVSVEKGSLPLDAKTACWLTSELIAAIASLHAAFPGLCHGAIAPERIIITPDARLVVTDHTLGAALPALGRSPVQHWRELRIALPAGDNGSAFDQRIDVAQVGTVAMALMLGHPLGDDYPDHVGGSANDTAALSAIEALDLLPEEIRSWMSRALQLGRETPFTSAVDARADFERVLRGTAYAQSDAPDVFKSACKTFRHLDAQAQENLAPHGSAPERKLAAAAPTGAAPAALQPALVAKTAPETAPDEDRVVRPEAFDPLAKWAAKETSGDASSTPGRRYLVAAAVLLVLITSATAFAVRGHHGTSATIEPEEGTLAVTTDPTGLAISVDGQPRGESPLRLGLAAGNHILEVKSGTDLRSVPVTVSGGGEISQFVEMPKTPAISQTGKLDIRTEPAGARVSVDGRRLGVSPITADDLTPGPHTVTVEGERGTITEHVTVRAGSTSALILPLAASTAAAEPASGWIAVVAPADVQVFENKRLLGTSGDDRIMALAGKHDLEFVSDVLGFRDQRTVTVTANQASTITLNWPKGSLALNAQPWAEVWLDGERVGETPLGNLSVPIGPHDIVFRHPELGEQRYKTLVTLAGPVRLSADLRKK